MIAQRDYTSNDQKSIEVEKMNEEIKVYFE